jgi:hypothetical protein
MKKDLSDYQLLSASPLNSRQPLVLHLLALPSWERPSREAGASAD